MTENKGLIGGLFSTNWKLKSQRYIFLFLRLRTRFWDDNFFPVNESALSVESRGDTPPRAIFSTDPEDTVGGLKREIVLQRFE